MTLKPEIFEIRYDTPQHKSILAAIQQRRKMSYDKMSQYYETWTDMEERALFYVKPTEGNQARKQQRRDGKPQYTTIEIPYSFAMMLAAHTYWTSVFLGRTPVMQFTSRHGGPEQNTQAMEAVIDYQLSVGAMFVPLYVWLMDVGKYGLGVLGTYWDEEQVVTTQTFEEPVTYLGIDIGKKRKVKRTISIPGYKGNKVFNVRPQDWFPDPRVPIYRFQEGEFCARNVETGWNHIMKKQSAGVYYNIEALRKNVKADRTQDRDLGSSQLIIPEAMDTLYLTDPEKVGKNKGYVELLEMDIELVPSDWKLGPSTYPEKWRFVLANNAVIISAQPKGALHNRFDFDVLEYEIEGYGLSKRGMLEIANPLNEVMTWLFNSHMHNVRRVLNDQLIVDPSRIVMKDLQDPQAGRLIRLKPAAYGTDPKLSVSQLQVVDITRTHLTDAQGVGEILQRLLGVNDNIMGAVNSGGRKTATEVRSSSTFGLNRLKTNCEYMSSMGFTPWAQKLIQNTQQHYDDTQNFLIAGNLMKQTLQVSPEMIAGFYDFVPVDGTMPVDRFALANLWKELLGGMSKFGPGLLQGYDIPGIFSWIAQLGGMKNFDQFRVQVQPDQQMAQQAAAGNVVPLGAPGGRGGTSTPAGSTQDLTQVPQSGSVAGVGRTA